MERASIKYIRNRKRSSTTTKSVDEGFYDLYIDALSFGLTEDEFLDMTYFQFKMFKVASVVKFERDFSIANSVNVNILNLLPAIMSGKPLKNTLEDFLGIENKNSSSKFKTQSDFTNLDDYFKYYDDVIAPSQEAYKDSKECRYKYEGIDMK